VTQTYGSSNFLKQILVFFKLS